MDRIFRQIFEISENFDVNNNSGVTMYILSHNVDYYLGEPLFDGDEKREPNLTMLTAMFFFLNFLAATQVPKSFISIR